LVTDHPAGDPAERVFRYLRPKIEGLPYPSLRAKQLATEHHLRQLAADREKVTHRVVCDQILDPLGLDPRSLCRFAERVNFTVCFNTVDLMQSALPKSQRLIANRFPWG